MGNLKPVEDQEMEDDPGDDEVDGSSDLSNDDEEEDEEEDDDDEDEEDEEEGMQTTILEDAGGEAGVGGEDGQGEDEEMDEDDVSSDDSSEDTPGSGAATPDPNKLTKRQRGQPDDAGSLMALDMAPQQRKVCSASILVKHANTLQFFTDAEKAMKKDEHARKRKELTKRKIQEEKNAALNRLVSPLIHLRFLRVLTFSSLSHKHTKLEALHPSQKHSPNSHRKLAMPQNMKKNTTRRPTHCSRKMDQH